MPSTDELCEAIDSDDLDRVRQLLELDSTLANATAVSPPPLHWAIYRDRPRMVELLLDHGAAIKAASGGFEQFRELPSRQQYERIVTLLRDLGVES